MSASINKECTDHTTPKAPYPMGLSGTEDKLDAFVVEVEGEKKGWAAARIAWCC